MPQRKRGDENTVNIGKLITEVQNNPVLFDVEDSLYRDQEKAVNIWQQIGKNLEASGKYKNAT